jgi:hypothetical protein
MSLEQLLFGFLVLFQIMALMKLSELNSRLLAIETKVDALLAAVGDPTVPADVEETLTRLEGKLPATP